MLETTALPLKRSSRKVSPAGRRGGGKSEGEERRGREGDERGRGERR